MVTLVTDRVSTEKPSAGKAACILGAAPGVGKTFGMLAFSLYLAVVMLL